MPLDIQSQLEKARRELLDTGARNRLINTPLGRGRTTRLDVVDERSADIFRILYQEHQEMSFLPSALADEKENSKAADNAGSNGDERAANSTDEDEAPLGQPDEESSTGEQYTDRFLQTSLSTEQLQKRLLRLSTEARTIEEEQGVGCLFLALGFLEFYESPNSDKPRFAPLVLVPVELHRKSANSRYKLKALDEDITTNLSLQEKLKAEFGLKLPSIPDIEDFDITAYYDDVEKIIVDQHRWRVRRDDLTLWFFSFAKFLMFRDLQSESWPEEKALESMPLVTGLLGDTIRGDAALIGEDEHLDDHFDPRDTIHIVDADGSQALAIAEVRRGTNLVIQGPPGTGKSQTITNIIASAVKDGKTVLFVAEKLAALQVVKSRLDCEGLGDMCFELHSHKANKRTVYGELERTLGLSKPKLADLDGNARELTQVRDKLNRYVSEMHAPLAPLGSSPFQIIGRLCALRKEGLRAFELNIPGVSKWDKATFAENRQLLHDVIGYLQEFQNPRKHSLWGIEREEPFLPSDLEIVRSQIHACLGIAKGLNEQIQGLQQLIKIKYPDDKLTLKTIQRVAQLAELLIQSPRFDRISYANDVWTTSRSEIAKAVDTLRSLSLIRHQTDGRVSQVAWTTDLTAVRMGVAKHGRSWWRWLFREYRDANAVFRTLAVEPVPIDHTEKLQLVDDVIRGQQLSKEISPESRLCEVASAAFGEMWRHLDSDPAALQAIVDWDERCSEQGISRFREVAAKWISDETKTALASRVVHAVSAGCEQLQSRFDSLSKFLQLSLHKTFRVEQVERLPLSALDAKLEEWQNSIEALNRWTAFRRRLRALGQSELRPLLEQLVDGVDADSTLDRFDLYFFESAMRRVLASCPTIADFDRAAHENLQKRFVDLDKRRIKLAKLEVALAHYERIPNGGEIGEVGIVRGEARKKRKQRSIRNLIKDAGRAIQSIKPVFMMSPISVAQFLEPGAVAFDLLVIDEASQVRPVEALGAVARCKQLVVVGDNRQLPPTQFFDRSIGGDDREEDEENEDFVAGDVESVLDLCVARGVPGRMLRWHYRSRHHSLIALSNREFYESRLFVVPSPEEESALRGLHFRFIQNGLYDRGGSRTNRIEARAVAKAVMDHALDTQHSTSTERWSLGVGTFSVAQRDAILDELELLRRQNPQAEGFFAEGNDEPFFVKNLENIQGDERDVILISVGYGKDRDGYFAMGFGPLSAAGGERRLNVLITRARQRCEVFSSITGDDIDLRRTTSRGAVALKNFLKYAESGDLDMPQVTGGEMDSEFEAQVAEQLRQCGYAIECQVGTAGFFIDLAVVDPDRTGRYLLGIECDGATYHSSRWARDRDRLREQVLTAHGWKLHRIWSTDWFQNTDSQMRKLIEAIENERNSSEFDSGEEEREETTEAPLEIEREHHSSDSVDDVPEAYREARFSFPQTISIVDAPIKDLARIVSKVVEIEGPIHVDEIARRVTTLAGLARTGSRITAAVSRALGDCLSANTLREENGFYWPLSMKVFPIRNREAVASSTILKPDMLPPMELRYGIRKMIADHFSVSEDECVRELSRMLGFKKTSAAFKQQILSQLEQLIQGGDVVRDGSLLKCVAPVSDEIETIPIRPYGT